MNYNTNAFKISQGLVPRAADSSRKSKAASSSPKGKSSPSSRGRIGKLAALKNMPPEIFFLIIGWLLPLDLLHLSRTSKFFRSLLMSKQKEYLWKAARKNVPGLPDCPYTLSEPRYAAFLFDQYCFSCGVARSTTIVYNLSLRFCAPCCNANIFAGDELRPTRFVQLQHKDQYWSLLVAATMDRMNLVPAHGQDPETNRDYHGYYLAEAEAVQQELTRLFRLEDKRILDAFLDERMRYVREMQAHGQAVAAWRRQTLQGKHEQAQSAKSERRQAIKEKLFELGYSENDFPVDNKAWENILNQPTKLNPKIWKAVHPKLIALIDQERQRRLQIAFEARLEERRKELAPYYDNFVKTVAEADRPFMPNLHDVSALPSMYALLSAHNAEVPVTLARLVSIRDRLCAELPAYIEQVKRDLVEMQHVDSETFVSEKAPMPVYDAAQIDAELAKATMLFRCHNCPVHTSLSARDICTHWRTAHPLLKWNDNWPPNENEDRRRGPEHRPKKLPWVSAVLQGARHAEEALAALGLAGDVSYAEMDRLVREGRLVCACADPSLSPAHESSWGILLLHIVREQCWHANAIVNMISCYSRQPGDLILDNHQSFESCLMLLSVGEQLMQPDYGIPEEDAKAIAVVMDDEQYPPACKICHDLTRERRRSPNTLWMPKDVNVLAHHMRTKHGRGLTKDLLLFKSFTS